MPSTPKSDPAWIPTAPISFERQVEINATPAHVWQDISVNETWVDWYPGFKACHFTSDAPHGVGSMRHVHMDNFKVEERITLWVPNERWGMTVTEINAPVVAAMAEEVKLLPTGDATTVTWRIGVELTRLGRPFRRPLVKKSMAGLEAALAALALSSERRSIMQS